MSFASVSSCLKTLCICSVARECAAYCRKIAVFGLQLFTGRGMDFFITVHHCSVAFTAAAAADGIRTRNSVAEAAALFMIQRIVDGGGQALIGPATCFDARRCSHFVCIAMQAGRRSSDLRV